MSYRRIETDTEIEMRDGRRFTPVVTFADNYGGRVQIVVDDGCYALCLRREGNVYQFGTHIFATAHEALLKLPALKGSL